MAEDKRFRKVTWELMAQLLQVDNIEDALSGCIEIIVKTLNSECGTIWLIAVPLAFISSLVWHLPIHLALLMTRTESLVKAVILTRRYKSKKWMNTVIEDL